MAKKSKKIIIPDDPNADPHSRYTPQQVLDALIVNDGWVGKTAKYLKCDCGTVYNYMKRYPIIKECLNDIREQRHDIVESALMRGIEDGIPSLIIFYLKTQCRGRGYNETLDVNADSNIEFTHTIINA